MTEIKFLSKGLPRVAWDKNYENILLTMWEENVNGFRSFGKNTYIHNYMAECLQKDGLKVTGRDVKTKMGNLARKYRTEARKVDSSDRSATKWEHFNKMHDILSNMEKSLEESNVIIKCGEVKLIKNDWNLQLVCAQCGKKMTEIQGFLLHSLQHHFSVSENEINKLISQLSREKHDEESVTDNSKDEIISNNIFLPTDTDIGVDQNYIVKEEYEVMETNIEDMKKYFEKEEAFENHVEEKDFICKHCLKAFDNITDYVQHVEQHVGFEVYDCPKCDQFNATFMQLKEHIKLHVKDQKNTLEHNVNQTTPTDQEHNEASFEVSSNKLTDVMKKNIKIEEVTDDREEFYLENLLSISKNIVQNEDTEFHRVSLIQNSDLKETDEIESPYNAENKTINHHQSAIHQKHVMEILQATSPTNTEPADPKEQQVNTIFLSDCSNNEEFIKSHEGEICQKSIKHQHISVHHKQELNKELREVPQRKGEKQCDVCQKTFNNTRSLNLHKRIHNKGKFSCKICGIAFADSSNLTTHLKRHLGIKKHKCTFCEKSFVVTTELKAHMRRHMNERNHGCELCGKRFFEKKDLKAHQILHTGKTSFSCGICSMTFELRDTLSQHIKSHTNIKEYV